MRYIGLVLVCLASPVGACGLVGPTEGAVHLAAINAARGAAGLDALARDPALSRMAQAHACDMSTAGYFDHTAPDGQGLADRARHADVAGICYLAENIARGQRDIPTVMETWLGSAGHRANLLDPDLTHVGLGRAPGPYWVQVFGRRC